MENLKVCVNAVLPIFIVTAAGYLARRLGCLNGDDVFRFNKLVFNFFMPVMMFYNVYVSDLAVSFNHKLLVCSLLGVLMVWLVCTLAVLHTEKIPARRGVMIQGLYRSNFVIIGLPLVQQLMPEGTDCSLVIVLIATVVPLYNVLAVVSLELFGENKQKLSKLELAADILKNPMILGTIAGVLFYILDIRLPSGVVNAAKQMANATSPLLMFLLGGFFDFSGLKNQLHEVTPVVICRLVIIPAVMLAIGYMLGFRGIEFASIMAVFAAPTAIASFTMAQQMGGEPVLAGNFVVATSALCPVTLFAWSMLLKTAGVI